MAERMPKDVCIAQVPALADRGLCRVVACGLLQSSAQPCAAEEMVGAGPDRQRLHPNVAAAAAGDGAGAAPGIPPPARPLVAPHQVDLQFHSPMKQTSFGSESDVASFSGCRWEAWSLQAASPRGLPFRETLHMLLRARLGLSVGRLSHCVHTAACCLCLPVHGREAEGC
jgi:hypothetical protein